MTHQIILLRHGHCKKLDLQPAIDIHRSLGQRDWPLSDLGQLQITKAGEHLSSQNLKFAELLTGSSVRNRQSAAGLQIPNAKWQIDDCLDSRLRTVEGNISHDMYHGKGESPYDESYKEYLNSNSNSIFGRIDRHWNRKKNMLIVTCRELILGIQFRLQKISVSERVLALAQKKKDSGPSILDCADGEMIELSSISPSKNSKVKRPERWFRWQRRISPLDENRTTDWKRFRIATFSNADLLDETKWGGLSMPPRTDSSTGEASTS